MMFFENKIMLNSNELKIYIIHSISTIYDLHKYNSRLETQTSPSKIFGSLLVRSLSSYWLSEIPYRPLSAARECWLDKTLLTLRLGHRSTSPCLLSGLHRVDGFPLSYFGEEGRNISG